MTRVSENRVSHLAHLILDELRKSKVAEFPQEGRALAETKQVLREFFQGEDQLEDLVRRKIESLSRPVPVGSREWDILHRKYYEEELRKRNK